MINGPKQESLTTLETNVQRLFGKQHNRQKELALVTPTRALLYLFIDELVSINQGMDQLIGAEPTSQRLNVYWRGDIVLTQFLLNNTKSSQGTHVPDFVIHQKKFPILAIECKNVNPEFLVNLRWLKKEAVNRFENYRDPKTAKLAIFSYFIPDPDDKTKINALERLRGVQ